LFRVDQGPQARLLRKLQILSERSGLGSFSRMPVSVRKNEGNRVVGPRGGSGRVMF